MNKKLTKNQSEAIEKDFRNYIKEHPTAGPTALIKGYAQDREIKASTVHGIYYNKIKGAGDRPEQNKEELKTEVKKEEKESPPPEPKEAKRSQAELYSEEDHAIDEIRDPIKCLQRECLSGALRPLVIGYHVNRAVQILKKHDRIR